MKQHAKSTLQPSWTQLDACCCLVHLQTHLHALQENKKDAWRSIPELKDMRKKSFRKYLRSLKTEEEREQAKADRSLQTAKKHQLIQDFIANQKKEKRQSNVSKVIKQIQEGTALQTFQ